jgi:hypothetical protein
LVDAAPVAASDEKNDFDAMPIAVISGLISSMNIFIDDNDDDRILRIAVR